MTRAILLSLLLALPVEAAAQSRDDADSLASPWRPAAAGALPPGNPHFVLQLSGGFLEGLFTTIPYLDLELGFEIVAGPVRIRLLVAVTIEEVSMHPPRPRIDPPAQQGGVVTSARLALGGDLLDWLGLRVVVGAGVQFWNDLRPTVDGAVEITFRLTDERRLELGLSAGPSLRYLAYETSPMFYENRPEGAARLGLFIGGVL